MTATATQPSTEDVTMDITATGESFRDRSAFAGQIAGLRAGGGTLNLSEKTLMVLGGIIAPLGLAIVLLGWVGASQTTNLFEQIPYLISGGLFGLGLVFLGSFFYFAHWITELVKESRAQSVAIVEAISRLEAGLASIPVAQHPVGVAKPIDEIEVIETFVATERGSMAHRSDCVVVAGKADLVAVTANDGFKPCKLCEPFDS